MSDGFYTKANKKVKITPLFSTVRIVRDFGSKHIDYFFEK